MGGCGGKSHEPKKEQEQEQEQTDEKPESWNEE